MIDSAYEKLPAALNARSKVFPAVQCNEFYNLAKFLFTPEEAAIFAAVPLDNAPIEEIAENLNTPDLKKLTGQLETMADKGLIQIRERNGEKVYEALPLISGIIELQMMRGIVDERHKKIDKLWRDYIWAVIKTKIATQFKDDARTMINNLISANSRPKESYSEGKKVTVEKDVDVKATIVPYQEIKDLLLRTDYISCGTCTCRHQGALRGKRSIKHMDFCMTLGESAKFAAERGFATQLTKEEALKRIEEAEEAGLIHQFTNSPDKAINLLCNCYKDLCPAISGVSKSPVPSMAVNARWLVNINEDDCTACEACIPRCQMDALKMVDGKLTRDEIRCIGCGICMWVCPTEALYLEQREAGKVPLKQC